MTDSEITLSVLLEIRERMRGFDAKLDLTNEKVDRGFEQVDQRFEQVDQRFVEIGHALVALGVDLEGQIRFLTRYLTNKTEVEIADLRERVTKLEDKDG